MPKFACTDISCRLSRHVMTNQLIVNEKETWLGTSIWHPTAQRDMGMHEKCLVIIAVVIVVVAIIVVTVVASNGSRSQNLSQGVAVSVVSSCSCSYK